MESMARNGIVYRTKLMPRERAERFAACLRANPRFQNASTCESPRSAGRYYVSYVPANPERREEMHGRQVATRAQRAEVEGGEYLFVIDTSERFAWCRSVSGEVYETTEESCSCPDYEYRGRHAQVPCKHQLALRQGIGTLLTWSQAASTDAREAEAVRQARSQAQADRTMWG